MQLSILNWELHHALMAKKNGNRISKEIEWPKQDKLKLLRSKMENVLTFNGEDEMFLAKKQMKTMAKEKPAELVEIYQCTAVYLDVIKGLSGDLGESLAGVNDAPMTVERKKRIEQGYLFLAELLVETFGLETACLIIADTQNAINLEKIKNGHG